MKTKNKDKTPKFIALAVICLLVGAGIGLVGYHYFFKPQSAVYECLTQGNTSTNWQSTKVESTKEMVEEIVLLGNGKKGPIDPKCEEGIRIASLLTCKLHELNLQAKCAFSKEDIQEIEQKDRSIRLFFKKPLNITISRWTEPEERYHIPTDKNEYRILKEVDIWVYELTPENQQLDGEMIGDWKINVWEDQKPPEDEGATDEERAWIWDQIKKWREDPEMQIAGTSIDSSARKTVTFWVYGLTPENQQLHRKMIDGWEIIVAQSPMPADQKKSREIAEEYLLNSLTFRFDGIENSLKLVDTNTLKCPYCWEFVFEFQCRHAGYGNKTGQMLAQVITPHTVRIIIEYGRVTSAIMDKKWDMLEQKMIDSKNPIISVNSTVFEGARWMSILSDGKVTCYSDHYYPGYKEIIIKEGHISREEIDALLNLFSNLGAYSEYTVNASEKIIRNHMDCIFDPVGGGTEISCIPLNKTLRLRVRPPSFPEPETATITAKEIMERIDRIYREAEVSERRKEISPYHAKPLGVTIAYHEKALVVAAVVIIALMIGVMGFILKKRRR